ncbi:hypothetical protein EVAR_82049_1 [Eumeta japonica]|uniref:Uncharacterized protein n=1 Tax=Eumeta variegata TaxID=151549 RepID=A0A4C1XNA9_EUMVA|nr:hypothetical protein EVAR_82049_1 [Eumeta japonica]
MYAFLCGNFIEIRSMYTRAEPGKEIIAGICKLPVKFTARPVIHHKQTVYGLEVAVSAVAFPQSLRVPVVHFPVPSVNPHPLLLDALFPQEAGNALVTPLQLRISMGGAKTWSGFLSHGVSFSITITRMSSALRNGQ